MRLFFWTAEVEIAVRMRLHLHLPQNAYPSTLKIIGWGIQN